MREFSDEGVDAEEVLNNIDKYLRLALKIIKREGNISSYELAEKLGIDPMIFILYLQDTLINHYNRKYFTVKEIVFCTHCKKYYDPSIKYCPICGRKTTRMYIFNTL